jgi:hypothetical protein
MDRCSYPLPLSFLTVAAEFSFVLSHASAYAEGDTLRRTA